MIRPPFLELAYYVGATNIRTALMAVTPTADAQLNRQIALGLLGVPGEVELLVDGGKLIVRAEGDEFSGGGRASAPQANLSGRRIYERFLEIADRIEPSYGAILVEYTLEEPDELVRDPRSLAFTDFYLSRKAVGGAAIREVLDAAGAGAYVEELRTGVYVSMHALFNPRHERLEADDAQWRSARIGSIVGAAILERSAQR